MRAVTVADWPITLVQALKLANLAESGAEAKQIVEAGLARVNGEPETRKRRKLAPGDVIAVEGRGAVRLEGEIHHGGTEDTV